MDQEASIKLWQDCQGQKNDKSEEEGRQKARDHWNQWANGVLAKRAQLEREDKWKVEEEKSRLKGLNDESCAWLDEARVDFGEKVFARASGDKSPKPKLEFNQEEQIASSGAAIDFEGFIFPGECIFQQTTFDGWVWFKGAEFHGPVRFNTAHFLSWAGFQEVTFHARAWINEVVFEDHAIFSKASFHRYSRFDLSEFNSISNFSDAAFFSYVNFMAISAKSGFLFESCTFVQVPNFHQAHFSEAPIIGADNIKETTPKDDYSASLAAAHCWGALKRLANQSEDHHREIDFFIKELRARPWKGLDIKKVIGTIYGIISGYGQSIVRPFVSLFTNSFLFYFIYLHLAHKAKQLGGVCHLPGGDVMAAKFLAIVNNVPFLGSLLAKGTGQDALNCVGIKDSSLTAWVVVALSMQLTLASLFIFFLLLAFRNYFRIR